MTGTTTTREIAEHLADYLEANPDVCADLNAIHGWLRFRDGEWRIARYAGGRTGLHCVQARAVDREAAVDAIESNPSSLEPVAEAGEFSDAAKSIWEHADEQDAFSDRTRCYWCGHSDRTRSIECFETVEDGECELCSKCESQWRRHDEIVATVQEAGSA